MLIKKSFIKIFIILFLAIFSLEAFALSACNSSNRFTSYWVADPSTNGGNNGWDNPANWSTSSGGSSGAKAPTNKCGRAIFNGGSVVNPTFSSGYHIRKLTMANGYSGTIDLDGFKLLSYEAIALHDGTLLLSTDSQLQTFSDLNIYPGGTLDASNAKQLKVKGNVVIGKNPGGGVLTAPGGNSITSFDVKGGFKVRSGATFNHNNGTVTFATQGTGHAINIEGNGNFYNIYKKAQKHIELYSNITVENDLTIKGKGLIKAANKNIKVGGDWTVHTIRSFDSGTGKVIFNGSSQTIS